MGKSPPPPQDGVSTIPPPGQVTIDGTIKNVNKTIFLLVLTFLLNSCANPFEYKENKWVQVTESRKENYQAVYVDENRIECDSDGNCMAWLKMIFSEPEIIPFRGSKDGQVSGYMMAKRVDSSVKYLCNLRKTQVISYQIYDKNDKLIDSKWIRTEPEALQPGTVQYDIWRHVCTKKR